MAAPKILYVQCNLGGSWICDKYAYALQNAGCDIQLAELRFGSRRNAVQGLNDNQVPKKVFGFDHLFKTRFRITKAFERMLVDAKKALVRRGFQKFLADSTASHFIAGDPFALPLCANAAKKNGAKVHYLPFEHYRDHIGVNVRRKKQFIDLEGLEIPHAASVILCGDTIFHDYVAAYDCGDRAHIVYNGWPLSNPPKSRLLRQAAGLDKKDFVILYQGAIEVDRGLTDVIEALPKLPSHVKFAVMGYGHGTEQILEVAEKAGVRRRLELLPPVKQSELMDYTVDADVGVIPLRDIKSHRYACPGKLFEFIGAGLPLVVSDLPDLRRFAYGHKLGEVFHPGDSSDLAKALMRLIDFPDHRAQCAKKSQELHQSTVCWELQSRKLCDVILR